MVSVRYAYSTPSFETSRWLGVRRTLAALWVLLLQVWAGAAADELALKKIDPASVDPPVIGAWWSTEADLNRIVALPDGKTLVAVGDGWTTARSRDGGATWTWGVLKSAYASFSGDLLWYSGNLSGATALADGKTLVAVGKNGMVLRSHDGGVTWGAPIPTGAKSLRDVAALPDGKTVVAVSGGMVVRSRDGGEHWDPPAKVVQDPQDALDAVTALADGKTVLAVGSFGVVVRSRDAGEHWDPPAKVGDGPLTRQLVLGLSHVTVLPDGKTVVAVGSRGVVARSRDAGEHWDPPAKVALVDLRGVAALPDGKTVVAVGSSGVVVRSRDGGEHWDAPEQATSVDLRDVVAQEEDLIAVGERGSVSYSRDGGVTWEQPVTLSSHQLQFASVAVLADDKTVVAVGREGTVVRSRDGGEHWDPATKAADAHLLSVVALKDGKTVIAVGGFGTVVRSRDGGEHWDPPEKIAEDGLTGLAVLPGGKTVVAVGEHGAAVRSRDGGEHWDPPEKMAEGHLTGVAVLLDGKVVVAVGDAGRVVLSGDGGEHWDPPVKIAEDDLTGAAALSDSKTVFAVSTKTLLRSRNSGKHWDALWSLEPVRPLGITALRDGKTVVVVGGGGRLAVARSTDKGELWVPDTVLGGMFYQPYLRAIAPLGAGAVAVGGGIAMELPASERTAAAAGEYALASAGDALHVSWRYSRGQAPDCSAVYYDIVDVHGKGRKIETPPQRSSEPDGRIVYQVSWNPSEYMVPPGSALRYKIECTDPAVPQTWRQVLPETQVWQPFSNRISALLDKALALPAWQQAGLVLGLLLAVWLILLIALFAATPRRLLILHERLPEPGATLHAAEGLDKTIVLLVLAVHWLGRALLLWLGTSHRALDAWMAWHLPEARCRFNDRPSVRDRRIVVELPVKIGGKRIEQPWDQIVALLRRPSLALLVTGPGGGGKSTLAFRIARRVMGEEGPPVWPLAGRPILPLLIESDLPAEAATPDKLLPHLAARLSDAIGANRRVSRGLTAALLRSGRILVIVDGFSERSQSTRDCFNPEQPGMTAARLVVTSREPRLPGAHEVLEMLAIPPGALFDFIQRYLTEAAKQDDTAKLPDDVAIHEACARLTRLLREQPVTPLLAAMWAAEVARAGLSGVEKLDGVAAMMDSYVRRLLLPAAGDDRTGVNEAQLQRLRADAEAIAVLELGLAFQVGEVTRAEALQTLKNLDATEPERRLDLLLKSRLLEATAPEDDAVRIAPDPLAEHLVARERCVTLAGDAEAWAKFLSALRAARGNGLCQGFILALRACSEHRVYGRPIPRLVREMLSAPELDEDRAAASSDRFHTV